MENIKKQFQDILNNVIAPKLKGVGFRKSGLNFHARSGEIDWCVNIQKARWGYDEDTASWDFAINLGLTTSLCQELMDVSPAACPWVSQCVLRSNLKRLAGVGGDWLTLSDVHSSEEVRKWIYENLGTVLFPIVKKIHNTDILCAEIDSLLSSFRFPSPIQKYAFLLSIGNVVAANELIKGFRETGCDVELMEKINQRFKSL